MSRLSNSCNIKKLKVYLKELKNFSYKLRKFNFNATAIVFDDKLLSLEKGDATNDFYGIAADIGTTTIAVYLMDLNKGNTIDVISAQNNQRNYGADVISRINYTVENDDRTKNLKDIIYLYHSLI